MRVFTHVSSINSTGVGATLGKRKDAAHVHFFKTSKTRPHTRLFLL